MAAYTFEYPPSFATHSPIGIERSEWLPVVTQLCHHFLLTRFKLVAKQVFRKPRTNYFKEGMNTELVPYTFPLALL